MLTGLSGSSDRLHIPLLHRCSRLHLLAALFQASPGHSDVHLRLSAASSQHQFHSLVIHNIQGDWVTFHWGREFHLSRSLPFNVSPRSHGRCFTSWRISCLHFGFSSWITGAEHGEESVVDPPRPRRVAGWCPGLVNAKQGQEFAGKNPSLWVILGQGDQLHQAQMLTPVAGI